MDNNEKLTKRVDSSVEKIDSPATEQVVQSRRRIFRQGVSVVAVTLASRPVLAWHCKSPSVMASDALKPQSSLTGRVGRNWADETWGIAQWKGNAPRSKNNYDDDKDGTKDNEWWEINAPWSVLLQKVPALANLGKGYNQITMAELAAATNFVIPAGSGSKKVVCFLGNCNHRTRHTGTDFQKKVLVAQLNLAALGGTGVSDGWYNNDLDNCVTLDQLNEMASGSYKLTSSITWGQTDISNYLVNNWMSR